MYYVPITKWYAWDGAIREKGGVVNKKGGVVNNARSEQRGSTTFEAEPPLPARPTDNVVSASKGGVGEGLLPI
jgi:hypothetical protein